MANDGQGAMAPRRRARRPTDARRRIPGQPRVGTDLARSSKARGRERSDGTSKGAARKGEADSRNRQGQSATLPPGDLKLQNSS